MGCWLDSAVSHLWFQTAVMMLPCLPVISLQGEWSCSVMSDFCYCMSCITYQAPLSMGFSRHEYWSGVPFPSPGDLPYPGIKPQSPALQADSLPSEPPGKPFSPDHHLQIIRLFCFPHCHRHLAQGVFHPTPPSIFQAREKDPYFSCWRTRPWTVQLQLFRLIFGHSCSPPSLLYTRTHTHTPLFYPSPFPPSIPHNTRHITTLCVGLARNNPCHPATLWCKLNTKAASSGNPS